MDTADHNRIIDEAFGPKQRIPEFRLSGQDVILLKQSSAAADDIWTGQTSEGSFKHAMRGWGQSPAEAEAKFKVWVRYCLTLAVDLQRRGSHAVAIQRLGLGMHALADSNSPAHTGFQAWGGDGLQNAPGAIRHHFRELPSGDALMDAVNDLQCYYYLFLKKAGLRLPTGPG